LLALLLMATIQSDGLKASSEIAKQVITLSTGAVAFTVTFLDKFTAHGQGPISGVPVALYVSWALFGLSVLFSLWTLMAVTGTLVAFDRKENAWTLTPSQEKAIQGADGNVTKPAILMVLSFLSAIIAMIFTGVRLTRL
jgi:Fe2+ transport system protein B